jgi:flagellar biosynthetic protein FlhB
MADKSQRTEQPTAKHRKEIREKGKVARSTELGAWASLLAVAMLLPKLAGLAANRINSFLQVVLNAVAHPTTTGAMGVLAKGLETAALAALPIVLVCTGIGVASSFAQVGLRFTPKALTPQFSRISPRTGFSRIFSTQGLWSLGKTVVKLVILAGMGYVLLHHLMGSELGGATLPLPTTLGIAGASTSALLRDIGVVALVVAGADYVFQRRSYQQGLRMTKQEVKDENRRNDGSPEVRRALRSKARQLSRMRMMAAVASADVVVTNPTHFAVAIAYDRKKDRAPRVVAKGADIVAARIRSRAAEHGVPVVENPVLARTLHASCQVDDVVPAALYTAVARLLAFVYSLSPTAKMLREVHRMAGPPALGATA